MNIDRSIIKEGDKVKGSIGGLNFDWTKVTKTVFGDLVLGDGTYGINYMHIALTDHESSFKHLEQAIADAEDALEDAKIALVNAKRNSETTGNSLIGKSAQIDWPDWSFGAKRTFMITGYSSIFDVYFINGLYFKRGDFVLL